MTKTSLPSKVRVLVFFMNALESSYLINLSSRSRYTAIFLRIM